MKYLDILILIPIVIGAFTGYKRGLISELISLLACIIGFIVGLKFLGWSLNFLKPYIGESHFLPYISFAIIFFPLVFIINKFGYFLRKSLRYTLLGSFDSFAGAIVGMFLQIFMVSLFLLLANEVKLIPEPSKKETIIYPIVLPIAPKVINKVSDFLPSGGNILEYVKKSIQQHSQVR